ncbi:hypothetical protein O9993_18295 [Vibrio lentus]|nr:hypothetical protein [Vibrio lentus]
MFRSVGGLKTRNDYDQDPQSTGFAFDEPTTPQALLCTSLITALPQTITKLSVFSFMPMQQDFSWEDAAKDILRYTIRHFNSFSSFKIKLTLSNSL